MQRSKFQLSIDPIYEIQATGTMDFSKLGASPSYNEEYGLQGSSHPRYTLCLDCQGFDTNRRPVIQEPTLFLSERKPMMLSRTPGLSGLSNKSSERQKMRTSAGACAWVMGPEKKVKRVVEDADDAVAYAWVVGAPKYWELWEDLIDCLCM